MMQVWCHFVLETQGFSMTPNINCEMLKLRSYCVRKIWCHFVPETQGFSMTPNINCKMLKLRSYCVKENLVSFCSLNSGLFNETKHLL